MQGLQSTILRGNKKLQVEHPVHFQTVIFKSGQADPHMLSQDITFLSLPIDLKTADIR